LKKALVLAIVMVLGLGTLAFAQTVSGTWETQIKLDMSAADLQLEDFYSMLEVEYSVCGWEFGSTMIIDNAGLFNVFFDASGTLGAFTFGSFLDFDPTVPSFVSWESGAGVSIAGVDLYGYFAVQDETLEGDIGSGFLLGGTGTMGDCTVLAEAQFNLASTASYAFYYGWDYLLDWTTTSCAYGWGADSWSKGSLSVLQTNCTTAWSGLDVYLNFPFTCLDVDAYVGFDCLTGFKKACFYLSDIDLGIPWLLLDDFDICFTTVAKSLSWDIDIVLADTVCIVPIMSLDLDGTTIAGITLNALTLEYSWNGVSFSAGELLVPVWDGYTHYFTETGAITTSLACAAGSAYDQFFGFAVDGDACCGGSYGFSVYNFFDVGSELVGIFGWEETILDVEFGVGSNITLNAGFNVTDTGLEEFTFGFAFSF
jgi:hypothetical protein